MNRLFKYLDKAIKEVYKQDRDLIEKQSINFIVFRIGVYLNSLLKKDILYKELYVDCNFKDKGIDYFDLVIHDRITHKDLVVIKFTKDISNLNDDIKSIELTMNNIEELSIYGCLITIGIDNYECYKLSPRYYNEDIIQNN